MADQGSATMALSTKMSKNEQHIGEGLQPMQCSTTMDAVGADTSLREKELKAGLENVKFLRMQALEKIRTLENRIKKWQRWYCSVMQERGDLEDMLREHDMEDECRLLYLEELGWDGDKNRTLDHPGPEVRERNKGGPKGTPKNTAEGSKGVTTSSITSSSGDLTTCDDLRPIDTKLAETNAGTASRSKSYVTVLRQVNQSKQVPATKRLKKGSGVVDSADTVIVRQQDVVAKPSGPAGANLCRPKSTNSLVTCEFWPR